MIETMNSLRVQNIFANNAICNDRLWNKPEGADLIIRCHPRRGQKVHWMVHRDILMDMSEWMENYMPPEAEDVSYRTLDDQETD